MTTFRDFIAMYNTITLNTNMTWRAYDIVPSIKERHVRMALKNLGLSYAGELALPEAMARYGLKRKECYEVLGAWWLLSQIEGGRLMKVPLRGVGGGQSGGIPTGPPASAV